MFKKQILLSVIMIILRLILYDRGLHFFFDGERLRKAIIRQEFDVLIKLITDNNINIDMYDGNTPLHLACMVNDILIVKFLIGEGASIYIKNNRGKTPLNIAFDKEYYDILVYLSQVELLDNFKKKSYNINSVDSDGNTILHEYSKLGILSIVKFLINEGADINVKNKDGHTPYDIAIKNSDVDRYLIFEFVHSKYIKKMIEHGFYVNIADESGDTYLHIVCMYGDLDGVKLLIEAGANIYIKNNIGKTPLDLAYEYHNYNIVKYLTDRNIMIFINYYLDKIMMFGSHFFY